MAPQTLPLKDIKPIVSVPDQSLWLFAALVVTALALLTALTFWLLRRKRGRTDRRRSEALRRLEALNYAATKAAVYDFSLLGHFVTTPGNEAAFRALLAELEPYKFKKEVPPLEPALQEKMQGFIKEARHG